MASGPAGSVIFFLFLWAPLVLSATAQVRPPGARSVGLSGATSAVPGEIWPGANPASPASLPAPSAGFFAEEPYSLVELATGSFVYAQPALQGTLSVSAATFGFSDYRENAFTAGYARAFQVGTRRALYGGLQVAYDRVRIVDYGSAGSVSLSLGTQFQVIPELWFGGWAMNVLASRLSGENREQTFVSGVAFFVRDDVLVTLDVFKSTDFPASVRTGCELQLVRALVVRGGVGSEPFSWSAGAGFRSGFLTADLAVERHQWLGWSPAASLGVTW